MEVVALHSEHQKDMLLIRRHALDAIEFLYGVMMDASNPLGLRIKAAEILATSAGVPRDEDEDE